MTKTVKAIAPVSGFVLLFYACVLPLYAAAVPKPLRSRFVIGDPVWRELPVRSDLQANYERCWQTVVNALLENHFDIATMDKESGYIRTTPNEGVVVLGSHWFYKVHVSIKFVFGAEQGEPSAPKKFPVEKVRLQVTGELSKLYGGRLRQYNRGYDEVVLENVFNDLQSKLGTI